MPTEHLKAFLSAVEADISLQDKLAAAEDAMTAATIAKEAGFSITAKELLALQAEVSTASNAEDEEDTELSTDQLKDADGGVGPGWKANEKKMFWTNTGWKWNRLP